MELREWQYINKPVGNTATSSNNKSFKKRFDKLIKYYGQHLPAEVDYLLINLLTKDTLDFTENYDDGDKVRFNIFIDPITEAWDLKTFVNGQPTDNFSDKGWPELLKILRAGYIEVPATTTLEYKELLTEWVAMKNTKTSSSYKKRFEKLIKYHIDHASSELESITKKDIKDDSFHLGEHYNTGHDEFDRDIVVSYDKDSNTFMLRIFVDGKEVYSTLCYSYEEFVEAAGGYMFLPDSFTPEYDDLLAEWVDKNGKKVVAASQAASSSSTTNKEKFTHLLYYIMRNRGSQVLDSKVLGLNDTGFTYREMRRLPTGQEELIVVVNFYDDHWQMSIYKNGKFVDNYSGSSWETLLEALEGYYNVPAAGTKEYESICESVSSIADDFKEYETLWD